jgi:hypothetical protein
MTQINIRHGSKIRNCTRTINEKLNKRSIAHFTKRLPSRENFSKKIITFTKLSPIEVLRKISTMIEDPPISPEVDDYTEKVADELIKYWKEEKPSNP